MADESAQESERWAHVPAWWLPLLRGRPTATLVLIALTTHADKAGKCWPKIETIAAETGIKRSHVSEALADLRDAGLVRWRQRYKLPSDYRIALKAVFPAEHRPGRANGNGALPETGTPGAGTPELGVSGTGNRATRVPDSGPPQQPSEQTNEQTIRERGSVPVTKKKPRPPKKRVDDDVVIALVGAKLSRRQARDLAKEFPADAIMRQIAALPHREGVRNPPALLIKAISEDWPLPDAASGINRSAAGLANDYDAVLLPAEAQ